MTGFSLYAIVGGGVGLLAMWDVHSDRFMRFLVGEIGIGVGADTNALSEILSLLFSSSGGRLYVATEATLDEIAGFGYQVSFTGFLVGASIGESLTEECLYTTSSGIELGLGMSGSITSTATIYDSNWYAQD